MKRNMKTKIFTGVALAGLLVCGCSAFDDVLERQNYTQYDTSSFPKTEKDAQEAVNAMYGPLSSIFSDPENTAYFRNNLAGDDMFGGGSTTNAPAQAMDRFMDNKADGPQTNWGRCYSGIFRANWVLQTVPEMDDALFVSKEFKDYLVGQAYFLRAMYYWELTEKYETVPLIKETTPVNEPRASAEEVYELITSDLLEAIKLMPSKYGYTTDADNAGRATKYAAEGMLARIWLFYTGFYKKSDMFGVSKADVISYLKDVRDNSKFALETDQRNIWPYTNEYGSGFAYGTNFGTYSANENLHWVGNHSKETVWGIYFSLTSSSVGYNRMGEYHALRNKSSRPDDKSYPFGIGYTNGSVNPNLVKAWLQDPDYGTADKRLWGSVFAVENAVERHPWMEGQYVELPKHPGNPGKEAEKTNFYNKKYITSACYSDAEKSSIYQNFFYAYSHQMTSNNNTSSNRNDVVVLRYADVLLMLDELEQTVTGMNQLRARAGLKPYDSYTFERLQKERRYELCFEGSRYRDLRRWFPEQAGQIIYDNQIGAPVTYCGVNVPDGWTDIPGNGIVKRYAKTRGFWKISSAEILLSNGVLEETPGFGEDDDWLFSNGSLPYKTSY